MEKLLREVCTEFNVKRRAVQGYEKAGLVSATGHTNRGYLLYDETAQKRIADIRMYQDFGFSIKEIVILMEASEEVYLRMMKERLQGMYVQRDRLTDQIKNAESLIGQKN